MSDNINGRKPAEAMELQEFSAFFDYAPEPCCIATPEGILLRVNATLAQVLGSRNEDLAGHSLFTYLHADDRALGQQWLETLSADKLATQKLRLKRQDGNYCGLLCKAAFSVSARRIFIIGRELPEPNGTLEALANTHTLEELGALAGRLAHDFNNLLTRIHGYSCLLLDLLDEEDPNRRYMERIQEAGEQAVGITNQLLETSRRYAGVLAFADLIEPSPAAGSAAAPAPAAQPELAAGSDPSAPTILVVEDDAEIRDLMRIVLQGEGYNLLLAADGAEGLEIGRRYAGKINLLLTDVVMPRMDGLNLAKELQRLRPELAVLFVSGYAESKLVSDALQKVDTVFLPKPFGPQTLLEPVHKLLALAPAAAAPPPWLAAAAASVPAPGAAALAADAPHSSSFPMELQPEPAAADANSIPIVPEADPEASPPTWSGDSETIFSYIADTDLPARRRWLAPGLALAVLLVVGLALAWLWRDRWLHSPAPARQSSLPHPAHSVPPSPAGQAPPPVKPQPSASPTAAPAPYAAVPAAHTTPASPAAQPGGAGLAQIDTPRLVQQGGTLSILLPVTGPLPRADSHLLRHPRRWYVDFQPAIKLSAASRWPGADWVHDLRLAQFANQPGHQVVRLVLDLPAQAPRLRLQSRPHGFLIVASPPS